MSNRITVKLSGHEDPANQWVVAVGRVQLYLTRTYRRARILAWPEKYERRSKPR